MSHFKGPEVQPATDKSAIRLILDGLRDNGLSTAIIEGQTERTSTYSDILQQSTAIAAGLQSRGVTAGDYVALCCDNSILSYCVLLGTMFTGATAVIIPPPYADRITQLIRGHKVKVLFCDQMYHTQVNHMEPSPSFVIVNTTESMAELLNTKTPFTPYEPTDDSSHVMVIFFSSGTTGEPKGIQLTDVIIKRALTSRLNSNTGHHIYLVSSLFFWSSAFYCFIAAIRNNYSIVVSNILQGTEILRLVEKYKVTMWVTSPAAFSQYVHEPTLEKYDLSSVRFVLASGDLIVGSVTEEFLTKVTRRRATLLVAMASTECGVIAFLFTTVPVPSGSCGKLIPGVEVKIVNDRGEIVPIGTMGEILVKSPSITPGYWGQPQLTAQAIDKEGFYHSGDAGFFDEDGNLFLRGRILDLINFKGYKIPPVEVENILMTHPDVLDVAVVGQEHPEDVQWLTAFVVPKKGSLVTREELKEFFDGQVEDKMKLRGGVHFLDALPRVAIGKVIRKALRDKLMSNK